MASPLRLLVPIDFSPHDEVLYTAIAGLARQGPLRVELYHLLQPPSMPTFELAAVNLLGGYMEELRKAAAQQLEALKQRPELQEVELHTTLKSETTYGLAKELSKHAQATQADLILALAKPREGFDDWLDSSELMPLVRHSAVPMLTLQPGRTPQFGRILFATDFSEAAMGVYLRLHALARWLGAAIKVVKVITPATYETHRMFSEHAREFREALHSQERSALNQLEDMVYYNDEEQALGILHAAADHMADMVALATYGRRGISLLMNGSTTQEVLEVARLPVLTYNARTMGLISKKDG